MKTNREFFRTYKDANCYKKCRGKWFNVHHIIIKATIQNIFVGYMLQFIKEE